ncbi:LysR family transcriptional regulator [Heliobacterium chlorum]|uniref:LysR family transcriptional regulator n=1 Tax=Heliobacterium chlorum TaxID=2698 RepID=A0ABR7T4G8_HELCL|nr:LysR family transcriptional regulator [Heliobacterium chlorum]MBC9784855.1 LysR family transcriptional regulator [Heliobacterium chlorum]
MDERDLKTTAPVQVKAKLWIEVDGNVLFSQGRMRLLEAIDETGSISQAATKMGMSYRAAWGKVTTTEQRLGLNLVERFPGHKEQGAALTEKGRQLLQRFQAFNDEVLQSIDELFAKHVQGLVGEIPLITMEDED